MTSFTFFVTLQHTSQNIMTFKTLQLYSCNIMTSFLQNFQIITNMVSLSNLDYIFNFNMALKWRHTMLWVSEFIKWSLTATCRGVKLC